ncbi:MAG: alpha/beta hydrolase [Cellvibrio sp. 79]|nr:MAG: alpha/beta hydrolase [Cellvibrio sp. 79]
MSPVSFTRDQADALQASLPDLEFVAGQEGISPDNPLLVSYLACYRLDFSALYPGLVHALGAIGTSDFRIATQYWIPPQARGTLLVVHGYYDHVGIYDKVIAFGLAQGLAVLAFDLPGHGLSNGERAAIESFDQYGDVLETILQRAQRYLPSPWYALGQSTGGAALLNHLWRYESHRSEPLLKKTALCAPLILPRGWTRGRWLYMLIHRFVRHLPRGPSRSSHDESFIRFLDEEDCLQSRFLSVRWVGAMKNWDAQFQRWQPLEKSLLVIQGTDDQTVAWRYNLGLLQNKLPQAQVKFIAGAGHQLVNERDDFREQVFVTLRDYFCTLP